MKRSCLYLICLCALCIAGVAVGPRAEPYDQSLRELRTPPKATDEAQRVRIWFPITRTTSCRVTVDILDSSGTVVRHLMSRLMGEGYHNIYWDKRNDSGGLAAPGTYIARINDCGKIRDATVAAAYRPFEYETDLAIASEAHEYTINVALRVDSVRCQFRVATVRTEDQGRVIVDTLLTEGNHRVPLPPDDSVIRGRHRLLLYINEEFVREAEFLYLR